MKKISKVVRDCVLDEFAFKMDLPAFLNEIQTCTKNGPYSVCYGILCKQLAVLAQRAIELNDPALNIIMMNLSLYDNSHTDEGRDIVKRMREQIRKTS